MSTQNNRKQRDYKKLIGRIGNEYYFLDYIFYNGKDFKGATGSIMSPLTEEEYLERVDNYFDYDNMREFWQQAVEAKRTDLGLDDWIEMVKDTDGENGVIDDSHENTYGEALKEKLGEEKAFRIECIGGGRCFDKNQKWDEIFDKKLLKLILKSEISFKDWKKGKYFPHPKDAEKVYRNEMLEIK